MDVLEIDAASNNGVDNVRSLREDAIYAPAQVKKRVYIIDEVHMLSMSAFNALLKIIEEPPAHLMFILATTELHKVPATILSRCQRFAFRRIDPADVAARIHYVAYEEGIEISPEAANLLGRLADGALRDGLSLLDQCAAAATGKITPETVYQTLGIAGARTAGEILTAVADRDANRALTLFTKQYAEGKDLAALTDELVSLCRDLLLLKTAPKTGASMLTGVCTDAELKALLGRFTAPELLRHTRLLQDTASGFNKSANRRVDVELCLLRMCDPSLDLDAQAMNARLSRLETALESGTVSVAPAICRPGEAEGEMQNAKCEMQNEGSGIRDQGSGDADPVGAVIGRPPEGKANSVGAVIGRPPEAAAPPQTELPVTFWADLVDATRKWRPSLGGYINTNDSNLVTPKRSGDLLELTCATDMVRSIVDREDVRDFMAQKASALLRRPVRVRFTVRSGRAGEDPMNNLVNIAREHPDIFHIQ